MIDRLRARLGRWMDESLIYWIGALLILVVGVQIGIARGRELERTGGPAPETTLAVPADLPRCTNGDPPQRWTRVDAEAMIHAAQQAYSTAGHYGGSPAHKLAWASEGLLALELVKACWW